MPEKTMQQVLIIDRSTKRRRDFPLVNKAEQWEFIFLVLGQKNDVLDLDFLIDCQKPAIRADVEARVLLKNTATCSLQCKLRIAAGSHETKTFFRAKTLMLSDKAKIEIIPSLEILTNNVSAGHAATVGKLEPEQQNFLMSRGIDKAETEKMLVKGFVSEVVEKIASVTIRKAVQRKIEKFLARK